jgi:hypothetical protein
LYRIGAGDGAEVLISEGCITGSAEIRVIEGIEQLRAELELEAFRDGKVFPQETVFGSAESSIRINRSEGRSFPHPCARLRLPLAIISSHFIDTSLPVHLRSISDASPSPENSPSCLEYRRGLG